MENALRMSLTGMMGSVRVHVPAYACKLPAAERAFVSCQGGSSSRACGKSEESVYAETVCVALRSL